jgi:hypothetical protein
MWHAFFRTRVPWRSRLHCSCPILFPRDGRNDACGYPYHLCVPERTKWTADRQRARGIGAGLFKVPRLLRPTTLRCLRDLHLLGVRPAAHMLLQQMR